MSDLISLVLVLALIVAIFFVFIKLLFGFITFLWNHALTVVVLIIGLILFLQ